MEYKWEILSAKTNNVAELVDVVVSVTWHKIGTNEEGISGIYSDTCIFSVDEMPEDYVFMPYEQLSEEIIISWVQAKMQSQEDFINQSILKHIESNNVSIKVLPWNNQAPGSNPDSGV